MAELQVGAVNLGTLARQQRGAGSAIAPALGNCAAAHDQRHFSLKIQHKPSSTQKASVE
jgi:hypothetical protein